MITCKSPVGLWVPSIWNCHPLFIQFSLTGPQMDRLDQIISSLWAVVASASFASLSALGLKGSAPRGSSATAAPQHFGPARATGSQLQGVTEAKAAPHFFYLKWNIVKHILLILQKGPSTFTTLPTFHEGHQPLPPGPSAVRHSKIFTFNVFHQVKNSPGDHQAFTS